MVKTKPPFPVSKEVFRSVAAGMIAWLRTRGVHPPSQLSRPILKPGKIQLTPGNRSFNLLFSALFLLAQTSVQADTNLKMLGNLHRALEGKQDRIVFHESLRKDRPGANPAALALLGAAGTGGVLGALIEPKLLTSKKDLLVNDPSERELLSWQRTNPQSTAKMTGFMFGGMGAAMGSFFYMAGGGGLQGTALGVGAGAGFGALIGSAVRGSWGGAARWSAFGALSSLVGAGTTHLVGASLSK